MTPLPPAIADHPDEIRALCVKYHVKRLAVFGSAVKGTFDAERSDVDFVVEFFPQPRAGLHDVDFDLVLEPQDVLGRRIDLIERAAVRNPYFLYDAA